MVVVVVVVVVVVSEFLHNSDGEGVPRVRDVSASGRAQCPGYAPAQCDLAASKHNNYDPCLMVMQGVLTRCTMPIPVQRNRGE